MADRTQQAVLAGLGRAAADPASRPLLASKASDGLFPATATGRQAAQKARDEGLVHVLATETRGKVAVEVCTLSDKGLAYLLRYTSPRTVLEDFVRALEARQAQLDDWTAAARCLQATLDALRTNAEKVLPQLADPSTNGVTSPDYNATVLDYLACHQGAEDCPLPTLFAHAQATAPRLTVGQFHDVLRELHDAGRIYLHPWTGPLYALPEPRLALLVGHEVAYYASMRA